MAENRVEQGPGNVAQGAFSLIGKVWFGVLLWFPHTQSHPRASDGMDEATAHFFRGLWGLKSECLDSNLDPIYLCALGKVPGPQSSHLWNRTMVHEVVMRCHLQSTLTLFLSGIRKEKRGWLGTKVSAV